MKKKKTQEWELGFAEGVSHEREKNRLFFDRIKNEVDSVECECGEKWSQTDATKIVEEELDRLIK